ncbi:MAG: DUF2339 domain-containing protein [Gemmatimonadaceae bacterium]
MAPSEPTDVDDRLRRLEAAVRSLSDEVAILRAAPRVVGGGTPTVAAADVSAATPGTSPAAHDGLGGGAARSPEPARPRPIAPPPPPAVSRPPIAGPAAGGAPGRRAKVTGLDLETLVGRYGTLLLGALTIVLGVGAFLSWAIERVTIGPEARVALGALGALLMAALGLWLRRRDGAGTRRFGNLVLALALAVVHVVAWSAGPSLHVIPSQLALAAAAAASLLLAMLGWRSAEQELFVVGTGGALLAPFVTADQVGDPVVLLLYGWMVVTAAVTTLRDRRWQWAQRVLATGVLVYAGAALDVGWTDGMAAGVEWARRDGPSIFVLACVASALAVGGHGARSVLARLWLLVLLLPLAARGTLSAGPALARLDLVALAAIGTVGVYVALRLRDARQTLGGASAIVQPTLLLFAAFLAIPRPLGGLAAAITGCWAALAALAAWDARGQSAWPAGTAPASGRSMSVRDPMPDVPTVNHLFLAGLLSLGAIALALRDRPLLAAVAVAGHAILAVLLLRRVRHPLLFLTPAFGLLVAAAGVYEQLELRPAYDYTPFASAASAAALAVVAGWWICGRLLRDSLDSPSVGRAERALLGALGPVAAFVWVQVELGRAFSPERAIFLLIVYYATVGVVLIALGRRGGLTGLRRIGLGLAVIAALKAIVEATDFEAVGLRVGSYLLVGGFLMGVAYWYRGAGGSRPEDDEGAGGGAPSPERPVEATERAEEGR